LMPFKLAMKNLLASKLAAAKNSIRCLTDIAAQTTIGAGDSVPVTWGNMERNLGILLIETVDRATLVLDACDRVPDFGECLYAVGSLPIGALKSFQV
jgi:hypothetical protein